MTVAKAISIPTEGKGKRDVREWMSKKAGKESALNVVRTKSWERSSKTLVLVRTFVWSCFCYLTLLTRPSTLLPIASKLWPVWTGHLLEDSSRHSAIQRSRYVELLIWASSTSCWQSFVHTHKKRLHNDWCQRFRRENTTRTEVRNGGRGDGSFGDASRSPTEANTSLAPPSWRGERG